MNIKSKIFIVFALMCVSTTAAYSQDCNSYLRQATELVSQQKYCEAKTYYERYGRCNADADVSTEIAMCERRCKVEAVLDPNDEPVGPTVRENPTPTGNRNVGTTERDNRSATGTSAGSRPVQPQKSGNTQRFSFGVRAGLSFTNISERWDGKKPKGVNKSKFKPGFQLGAVADFSISDNLAIQPGILFATQGWVDKYSETGYSEKESWNLNYLQVPLNVQYKINVGSMNLLLQAGPYFGYAFSGKYKEKVTEDGRTKKDEGKIKFGTEDGKMSQIDFGLGVGVGLQFDNMQVGLGYNLGLKNLVNGGGTKDIQKNYGLALTVTYLFGK